MSVAPSASPGPTIRARNVAVKSAPVDSMVSRRSLNRALSAAASPASVRPSCGVGQGGTRERLRVEASAEAPAPSGAGAMSCSGPKAPGWCTGRGSPCALRRRGERRRTLRRTHPGSPWRDPPPAWPAPRPRPAARCSTGTSRAGGGRCTGPHRLRGRGRKASEQATSHCRKGAASRGCWHSPDLYARPGPPLTAGVAHVVPVEAVHERKRPVVEGDAEH